MTLPTSPAYATVPRDLTAGLVVFLVALPLCLGVALASNAPLFSGLVAGIVGGILVGILSGSQTSVSGPAAGLTAVVAAQIVLLGSFQAFLLAVVVAGVIQIGMGVARAGFLSAFFPTSVIKGLLAAIGVILICKQFFYVLGSHRTPNGFAQLVEDVGTLEPGAAVIGVLSVLLLVGWDQIKVLKYSPIPSALLVVLLGVGLSLVFQPFGAGWAVTLSHLVQVPATGEAADLWTLLEDFWANLQHPDFSQWQNPKVYMAALTIAAVASLETLLNLQAVDKIDPQQRSSPPSRELWAQGVGNVVSGLLGGLPVTSVIVRSSVNINAGGRTKLSAVFHGILLLVCVLFLAARLNMIPLSCLAAILVVTGIKLASPALVRQMWAEGKYQFTPFAITIAAIVLTDLLVGVLIGLGVAVSFILWSNLRRPIRTIVEKHLGGDVLKIELANQVSFLNRASLARTLDQVPAGGHLLLDASHTDYIDPDVLDLIRDFKDVTAPARGIEVSLLGFRTKYQLHDQIQYVDYSTRELQEAVTPAQVLDILKSGHQRFRTGQQLTRDFGRQVSDTADGEHPLALVFSCIDARTPVEHIFDAGVGDILSVRIAGPVANGNELGSMEYGCVVAGAKLILVMGHTRCRVVHAVVDDVCASADLDSQRAKTGTGNLGMIVEHIQKSIAPAECVGLNQRSAQEKAVHVAIVSRRNVARLVDSILRESPTLAELVRAGRIAVVGALYDDATGNLEFLS
ncbi:MAG: sulfate transporter [Gemmataceae bacterium]|nr:sulfate transporter [Gemmataceae bacterium]